MQLLQAIGQVRVVLNEATPRFWSNSEIIAWLNEGAQLMASEAKALTAFYQIPTVAGVQEYALPEDCLEVASAFYAQGAVLPIKPLSEAILKAGGNATGVPLWCYFRIGSTQYANVTGVNDITLTDIEGQSTRRKPKMVIGLYPIPVGSNNLTVGYYARHYVLVNSNDEFGIPDEYQRGIVAYAAACGKRKEQSVAEFNEQMGIFKEFKDRLCEQMNNNGDLIEFPRMKIPGRGGDGWDAGSSWIYVGDAT